VTTAALNSVAARVAQVQERIAQACRRADRDPAAVTLVAVSKTWPADALIEAWRAGVTDFGENRVQEALEKMPAVAAATGDKARFHFVGHLQTNKASLAARQFHVIHSLDSARIVARVGAATPGPRVLPVLLEVNVSGESSKFGVPAGAIGNLLAAAAPFPNISVRGLMTVAPRAESPEDVRPTFVALRRLAEAHGLPWLSMGMTEDFEVAIEEGATHVRIGRAIFGERGA